VSRIERSTIIHVALALFAVAIVGKAAQVQLLQRDRWVARAVHQHFTDAALPAPRGTITDASGRVLAESRDLLRVNVAPRELSDRDALGRLLRRAGVRPDWVRRAVDTTRKWVELPGTFQPSEIAPVTAMRGVHSVPVVQRVFSGSSGMQRIVGRVGNDGAAVDGVELALDSLLRGVRGTATLVRDGNGGALESPFASGREAQQGHTITLTINAALQDICERALADALAQMHATGGDIVVLNPHDGEVLALASQRPDPRSTAATALSEPFEPGSTIKPFVAARLLDLGRAHIDDVINTENGEWYIGKRKLTDEHKAPQMTLRDVIKYSSNIGIAKFAQRLAPREQFELLRDAGFGAPTGVAYPSESSGRLRAPGQWTKESPVSLAIGYEIAVTPLQLATAYGAIANGGRLLEPSLVREIQDTAGHVVWKHTPHVVRRLMSERTAATIREMLKAVVDSGTATAADLASFTLGGKSGTVRRIEKGIGYAAGHYNGVFAGLFPVEAPQYVIVVKIENPEGAYFGGKTAGPVTKGVLQAALAARDAALDRASLAERVLPKALDAYTPKARPADSTAHPVVVAAAPLELRRDSSARDTAGPGVVRYVVDLPEPKRLVAPASPPRAVPAVQGLPLRDALYALHRAGFHVRVADGAATGGGRTTPAAGASLPAGASVTLYREP